MTCSLFFSLLLAMSMRQADIASKAVFTAWRASPESPATDIELKSREFAELSCMARLLSVRIDVPRDRGDPGDVFERRAIDDLNFSWTSFLPNLIERSLKGSRSDRPLSRTEKRGDSPCARKEKKNSSRNDTGDMPVQAELSALVEQCRTALRNRAEDVDRGETSYPKARPGGPQGLVSPVRSRNRE